MMESKSILDHLFRHESGKLISVLTKVFGPHNLELAEDVVQDTLLKALEHWKFHGTPQNPSAWLYTAAKNKALDVIRQQRHHKEFAEQTYTLLEAEPSPGPLQFPNANEIEDEQLRMMFVCCHPSISEESQVALILKTLCGFSVAEIAKAFLTTEETVSKRLYRAKQQFREENVAFDLPPSVELKNRLNNVLTAIYLIFNEGYNSSYHDSLIREDLVEESLRLGKMLVDHPLTRHPESLSLLALLCFQSARLHTRINSLGQLVQLKDQDRARWNRELINLGMNYLHLASEGDLLSSYHLQAAIAHEHCIAKTYEATNWKNIIRLYDWLLELKPDPLIALNRLIAVGEIDGPAAALHEILKLPDKKQLLNYYLYHAVLGEFHAKLGHAAEAKVFLEQAMQLTHSPMEKQLLSSKIASLTA